MSYIPIDWKDRMIERPRTYSVTDNQDGTITLTPVTGEVYQEGTPLSANNMNYLQQGISALRPAVRGVTADAGGAASVTLAANETVRVAGTLTALSVSVPDLAGELQEGECRLIFTAGSDFQMTEVPPEGYTFVRMEAPVWESGAVYEVSYAALDSSRIGVIYRKWGV